MKIQNLIINDNNIYTIIKKYNGINYYNNNLLIDNLYCHINHLRISLTNLKYLNIQDNYLITLYINDCINLEKINCNNNQLIELKINNCDKISILLCGNNNLNKLNINHLINLKIIYCNNNKLNLLDVSNLNKISCLWCKNNNINLIDLSNTNILPKYISRYSIIKDDKTKLIINEFLNKKEITNNLNNYEIKLINL